MQKLKNTVFNVELNLELLSAQQFCHNGYIDENRVN